MSMANPFEDVSTGTTKVDLIQAISENQARLPDCTDLHQLEIAIYTAVDGSTTTETFTQLIAMINEIDFMPPPAESAAKGDNQTLEQKKLYLLSYLDTQIDQLRKSVNTESAMQFALLQHDISEAKALFEPTVKAAETEAIMRSALTKGAALLAADKNQYSVATTLTTEGSGAAAATDRPRTPSL